MEENTYPLFLKSDLYLEYTRTGGESPKPNPSDQSPSSGPAKPVPGYLPTLAEDEEWRWENASLMLYIAQDPFLSSGINNKFPWLFYVQNLKIFSHIVKLLFLVFDEHM